MSYQIEAERTDSNVPINLTVTRRGGIDHLIASASIRDGATTDYYLDFNDSTFKLGGWATKQETLTNIGSGFYVLSGGLNIGGMTNLSGTTNHLIVEYEISGTTGVSGTIAISGSAHDVILLKGVSAIVSGVWNANGDGFDSSGTMGRLQNQIGSLSTPVATVDIPAIVSGTWNANQTTFNSSGTMGGSLFSMSGSIDFIEAVQSGRWQITGNQLILYRADNTTEIARFDLKDSSGNPTNTNPFDKQRT